MQRVLSSVPEGETQMHKQGRGDRRSHAKLSLMPVAREEGSRERGPSFQAVPTVALSLLRILEVAVVVDRAGVAFVVQQHSVHAEVEARDVIGQERACRVEGVQPIWTASRAEGCGPRRGPHP